MGENENDWVPGAAPWPFPDPSETALSRKRGRYTPAEETTIEMISRENERAADVVLEAPSITARPQTALLIIGDFNENIAETGRKSTFIGIATTQAMAFSMVDADFMAMVADGLLENPMKPSAFIGRNLAPVFTETVADSTEGPCIRTIQFSDKYTWDVIEVRSDTYRPYII